jgi:hypothetical protein
MDEEKKQFLVGLIIALLLNNAQNPTEEFHKWLQRSSKMMNIDIPAGTPWDEAIAVIVPRLFELFDAPRDVIES